MPTLDAVEEHWEMFVLSPLSAVLRQINYMPVLMRWHY
jgi:hypothetical protein